MEFILVLTLVVFSWSQNSVDFAANGTFSEDSSRKPTVFEYGIPTGFLNKPEELSVAQLTELHLYCVQEINKYRSGELKFTNGQDDSNVVKGLQPYKEDKGLFQCSNNAALTDLVKEVESGSTCGGAHYAISSCPLRGARGWNTCCSRGRTSKPLYTVESIKKELSSCLQQMWDEGEGNARVTGHWETMRSETYEYVSCGFAWTKDSGKIMLNQDFSSVESKCTPDCSSCSQPTCATCCASDVPSTNDDATSSPVESKNINPLSSASNAPDITVPFDNAATSSRVQTFISGYIIFLALVTVNL